MVVAHLKLQLALAVINSWQVEQLADETIGR